MIMGIWLLVLFQCLWAIVCCTPLALEDIWQNLHRSLKTITLLFRDWLHFWGWGVSSRLTHALEQNTTIEVKFYGCNQLYILIRHYQHWVIYQLWNSVSRNPQVSLGEAVSLESQWRQIYQGYWCFVLFLLKKPDVCSNETHTRKHKCNDAKMQWSLLFAPLVRWKSEKQSLCFVPLELRFSIYMWLYKLHFGSNQHVVLQIT